MEIVALDGSYHHVSEDEGFILTHGVGYRVIPAFKKMKHQEFFEATNLYYVYRPNDEFDSGKYYAFSSLRDRRFFEEAILDLSPSVVAYIMRHLSLEELSSIDSPELIANELIERKPEMKGLITDAGIAIMSNLAKEILSTDLSTRKKRMFSKKKVK